jgi:hypothetical protein
MPAWFCGEIVTVSDGRERAKSLSRRHAGVAKVRSRTIKVGAHTTLVEAWNRAAEIARSDYLVFLQPRCALLPGWLYPMLSVFAAHADAGVVGGKILAGDGRLREAGRIVFRDGSTGEMGGGDADPERPAYQCLGEVCAVSADFLMTPRSLFRELGGFHEGYEAACFDVDYCLSVRSSGRRVYYQPQSVLVDLRTMDPAKRLIPAKATFASDDKKLFADRWRQEIENRPEPTSSLEWPAVVGLVGEG